jgi:hypothetical protein
VEADLSGHPQNERSGLLAFFYLMQNVCNLEHDQETEVHQALYKVRLLEFPGANVSQYVQLWRLITGLLIGRGVNISDGPKAFKRELKTVEHKDFIFDVRSYERENAAADLNTLFAEAIRLFNKHKGTWIVTTKAPSVFNVGDTKKKPDQQKRPKSPATQKAPGTLLVDAAVEATTVDEAHLVTTTIRRQHHHFACHETTSRSIFNGNHLWCKSIHHLRIDIQDRSPEGYRGSTHSQGSLLLHRIQHPRKNHEATHQANRQARNLLCRTPI